MYGLVNHAIQGLLTKEFGEDKWAEIKEKAGVQEEIFVSMQQYDDSITYNLVGAASEVTKVDAADLLEAFGRYWVLFTAEHGYAEMLDMAGGNFVEFVENLNQLHIRVGGMMPGLAPPSFDVERKGDKGMILTYTSKRAGLAPMVIGLIKGLGEKFDEQDLTIELLNTKQEEDNWISEFDVNW